MDFFDKLGKKASEAYKGASEKASKVAKETKFKMKINEHKSKIEEIYTEIGRNVYEKYSLQGVVGTNGVVEEKCKEIADLANQIANLNAEILKINDKKKCINCHAELEYDSEFCSKCGTKQPKEEKPEVKEAEIIMPETEIVENSVNENKNVNQEEVNENQGEHKSEDQEWQNGENN